MIQALHLRRSGCEAVAKHDLRHLCPIRRDAGCRVHELGSFAEKLRTYRGRCDYAERLHILDSVAIEPVNCTSRNAQCFTRPDVDLFSVHSPGQHSIDAIDCLLEMVVAMGSGRQRSAPGTVNRRPQGASRVLPVEQKSQLKKEEMLIGALLRVPAAIHRRIIKDLNASGFDELSLAHMAVFNIRVRMEFAQVISQNAPV